MWGQRRATPSLHGAALVGWLAGLVPPQPVSLGRTAGEHTGSHTKRSLWQHNNVGRVLFLVGRSPEVLLSPEVERMNDIDIVSWRAANGQLGDCCTCPFPSDLHDSNSGLDGVPCMWVSGCNMHAVHWSGSVTRGLHVSGARHGSAAVQHLDGCLDTFVRPAVGAPHTCTQRRWGRRQHGPQPWAAWCAPAV